MLGRAGWNSKNTHLLLGEALSYKFEGKVLNPFGIEIDLPFWVFKRLKNYIFLDETAVLLLLNMFHYVSR
jgi:hypothetical protein